MRRGSEEESWRPGGFPTELPVECAGRFLASKQLPPKQSFTPPEVRKPAYNTKAQNKSNPKGKLGWGKGHIGRDTVGPRNAFPMLASLAPLFWERDQDSSHTHPMITTLDFLQE